MLKKLYRFNESGVRVMVKYICLKCRREFDEQQLKIMMTIRCPYCGYRVIAKAHGEGIKVIKAI